MKKINFTCRIIFILSILLICSDVMSQTGNVRLLPEPKVGFMAGQAEKPSESKETGLLFYLSGEKDFSADFAGGGQVSPNFLRDVTIISDGANGKGFRAEDSQLMSYWAPGNIYAQRGTLSFFWRSRYPAG